MRKLCILLTVLFLCLLIVACGKQENTDISSPLGKPTSSSTPFDERADSSSALPDEVIDSSTAQSSETTGESVTLLCNFTERQKSILKAGGLLSYTKKG